jgi:peptidoglycan/xylan/chitin deacetylase (PgdA/CDA1 family)
MHTLLLALPSPALSLMQNPHRRALLARLLRLTLLPLLVRETIQSRQVTVVFFHEPSPERLRAHLAALRRRYHLISLRQFIEALEQARTRELPRKSLVLTLDDGHASNFALKQLFEELGVPTTIFLCSGIVGTGRRFWFKHAEVAVDSLVHLPDSERLERLQAIGFDEELESNDREALSTAEIEDLKTCVDFQSHTISHPVLPYCSNEKAEEEIFGSKRDLERRYTLDVYALAYPNGDYSDREVLLAKRAGYRCAVTADPGFNSDATNPFRLKRMSIGDSEGIDELIVKTSGVWGWVKDTIASRPFGYIPTPGG